MARPEKHVLVCTHSRPSDHPKGSCAARGGNELRDAFVEEFESRNLWGRFKLSTTSCLGVCEEGPVVLVYPEGIMYTLKEATDVKTVVEEHLLGGHPVAALKLPESVW
jgi:(2Fe-2S) ferredoxin